MHFFLTDEKIIKVSHLTNRNEILKKISREINYKRDISNGKDLHKGPEKATIGNNKSNRLHDYC